MIEIPTFNENELTRECRAFLFLWGPLVVIWLPQLVYMKEIVTPIL